MINLKNKFFVSIMLGLLVCTAALRPANYGEKDENDSALARQAQARKTTVFRRKVFALGAVAVAAIGAVLVWRAKRKTSVASEPTEPTAPEVPVEADFPGGTVVPLTDEPLEPDAADDVPAHVGLPVEQQERFAKWFSQEEVRASFYPVNLLGDQGWVYWGSTGGFDLYIGCSVADKPQIGKKGPNGKIVFAPVNEFDEITVGGKKYYWSESQHKFLELAL